MLIEDGAGKGYRVQVTPTNRLLTQTESNDASLTASIDGKAYGINTGDITLTTANPSAVFYIKNNQDEDMIFFTLIYQLLASTGGGTNPFIATLYRNPTAGTIVSGAVVVPVFHNLNFGSTKQISANVFKGAEGNTITDGQASARTIRSTPNTVLLTTPGIVLPRGASLGLVIQPPTGNTSLVINIAATVYMNNEFLGSNGT